MCGFAGAITPDKSITEFFPQALSTLAHRGPDAEGIKEFKLKNNQIVIGQNRLAIIDLSIKANQPMQDHTGQYWIVFNGEIYNYKDLKKDLQKKGHTFQTLSDTEVILEGYKAYGIHVVDKLLGMFAFAIYDKNLNVLMLARDHFGKKPLYYYLNNNSLIFASELKAITAFTTLKQRLTISERSVQKFLMYGYIPSPSSIFNEVKKLQPATAVTIDVKNVRITKSYSFWDLSKVKLQKIAFEDAVEETDKLLRESVIKRLIASDVPVGSFLSGGIDSSLVTTLASQMHPGIETFSVVYDDKQFDESEYVRMVGEKLSIKYNFFKFHDSLASDLLHEVVKFMDEPMADASLLPTTFIAKHTRKKVTVALSGDGGDELFGGYPKYNAQKLFENQLIFNLLKLGSGSEKLIDKLPISPIRKNIYKKLLSGTQMHDYSRHFVWGSGSFTLGELTKLLKISPVLTEDEIFSESKTFASQFNQNDFGNKLLFLDSMIQLPDWYLVKADRGSMSQSLEVRSPFLDKNLAEFTMSLPSKYKFSIKNNKVLLKEVAKKYLPHPIITRKKMGFGLPLNRWLVDNFKQEVDLALKELPGDLFEAKYISEMWEEMKSGQSDHGTKIWRLFILGTFFAKL